MKLHRLCAIALGLTLTLGLFSGCSKPADGSNSSVSASGSVSSSVSTPEADPNASADVMVLSGPTSVGSAYFMEYGSNDTNPGSRTWNFSVVADNSEVMAALNQGSVDIAATATNVAANLYNKTGGKITMLAANTKGVLYVLEKGDTLTSMADLSGKTLYAPANVKGGNPEFIFNYLLTQNGVDPSEVTIEWLTPQEITAKMAAADSGIALMPVPAATALMLKDSGVRQALDLSAEWDKVSDSPLVMGCWVVRTDFLTEHPDVVDAFLELYGDSYSFMTDEANLDEAAQLVAKHGITANAQIAKAALPQCNLTFLLGDDMRQAVQDYYEVLYQANPDSIGGEMPYDDFYYFP